MISAGFDAHEADRFLKALELRRVEIVLGAVGIVVAVDGLWLVSAGIEESSKGKATRIHRLSPGSQTDHLQQPRDRKSSHVIRESVCRDLDFQVDGGPRDGGRPAGAVASEVIDTEAVVPTLVAVNPHTAFPG